MMAELFFAPEERMRIGSDEINKIKDREEKHDVRPKGNKRC
jgi:hypothetical protein